MDVQIRRAKIEDAAVLGEILRSVEWFTTIIEMPPEKLQANIERGLSHALSNDSHLVLVAETGLGRLLGYVSVNWLPYLFLDGAEGFVTELFIHKAARGTSIGTQLLEAVKEEARRRGCVRLMTINGRTRESYQRSFFKKNGWREREMMANFVLDLN
jgi:GNAT superfamily N-acetyltransferase